jgi:hypothetical protein
MSFVFDESIASNFLFTFSFDGEVDEIADSDTSTHILTLGNCCDVLALHDACVSQGTKLNTDIYEL